MSQFDFSEYKPDEYEKYNSMMSDNKNIIYSFFMNKAFFGKDKNTFQIVVDEHFEHENMEYLVHSIQEKHPEIHVAHTDDSDEDSDDEKAYNEDMRKTAMSKYDISLDGIDDLKPQINIYSGAIINLHYGEGLLDFIYADFETPIKKVYTEERQLELLFERARANKKMADFLNDVSEKSDNGNWNLKPQKIYDEDQLFLNDFEQYELTFNLINEIAYASLYSAICPPVFRKTDEITKSIRLYARYISALQKEYRDLIEFCYDENLFPKTLNYITPAEKYNIYKSLINFPGSIMRREVFGTGLAISAGEKAPLYSVTDIENARYRLMNPVSEESIAELANKYNIEPHDLALKLSLPRGICVYYEFGSLRDILELEFTKMLEENIRFRKCKRCGRYFIMKGNYDTNYCDRIEAGTNRTCKDLAAQENYKKKTEGNEAIALYHKYYKRYAARVKVRQIKEQDFKKWKYEAIVKRDECSAGKITPAEFTEWLEGCFPNRKKKE